MNTTQTPAGTFTRTRCAEGFIISHESGDSEHVLTLAAVEAWIATYTAACEPIVVTGDVNGFFAAAAAEAHAKMTGNVVEGEIIGSEGRALKGSGKAIHRTQRNQAGNTVILCSTKAVEGDAMTVVDAHAEVTCGNCKRLTFA